MTKRLYPDMVQDVLDFYAKFNPDHVESFPTWPRFDRMRLAYTLVKEEMIELDDAISKGSIVDTADAIADTIYVLLGMSAAMGIDLRPIWVAVHRSNMAKEGGSSRHDGKIMKPDGWAPPDLTTILELQNSLLEPAALPIEDIQEEAPADA